LSASIGSLSASIGPSLTNVDPNTARSNHDLLPSLP
jgi:hypothetical protein